MVIDDLRALPGSPLVVAEGSTLPAWALSSGVAERSRAVWLLPTRQFQQATLTDRDMAPGPTALYLLLGETIEQEAREHRARTLTVDGSRGVQQMVTAVEELFAEALAEGPCAKTLAERRGLLREANQAIADQVRDRYGRPWAHGDAEAVVREFICDSATKTPPWWTYFRSAHGPSAIPEHRERRRQSAGNGSDLHGAAHR
jgi:hypothetical protein